ncbi:TonB-dependent receptor domain-containing protein [Horticoccus sp. 23ND18S-11]|uniref:TonB-dependent receptor domain-containing protein n=1 Tax=Horticoccus sp. 23ND18S-11 TaxID=3391832 RepID=UPI0039C9DBC3
MNIRSRKLAAVLSLFLGAGIVSNLVAQTAPKPDEKITLEKFVVTGSLIPFAAGAPAIPIKIVGAGEIEKAGISTDLSDVLRRTQPAFYGANNLGSDVANVNSGDSNGGSGLSLRNRPTLVLINGRRAAISPVLATGGNSFVDVSVIPLSAVERVEILSDGASATYGSDAVSGVINIILKTNYNGGEVGGSYGFSTNKGHWENRSYYGVFGASQGKTSLTVTTEWKSSDPLIQNERAYSTGLYRTPSFAGVVSIGNDFYYLNPSANAPAANLDLTPAQLVAQGIYQGPLTQEAVSQFLDLANYPTLLAKSERRSVTAAIEHRLTDKVTLFGDFIFSLNETESVLNAQPVTGSVAGSNPANPFNVTVTARNRFLTFPRIYANESTSIRGVIGIKGTLFEGWSYEAAANFNRTNHDFRNKNLIDGTKYTELVNSGAYNPFARSQAPGIVASMSGTQVRDFQSSLKTWDARVNGPMFRLPGGPVLLGLGVGFMWDELDFTNDRNDQTGNWLQATPRQPFNARSNVDGYYAEARIPIFSEKNSIPGFHVLELSLAARYDKYSTTSDPTVPKYSVRYLPFNDQLAFRGTYSESFVAPSLYDLYGPLSVGFSPNINMARYDSNGNALGVLTGNRQYRSQTGSNTALRPSESRNWSAGIVWSPKAIKGLSISADWFNIDERDIVSSVPDLLIVSDVEQKGPRSIYASQVRLATSVAGETHFTDGAPITAPGQITSRPSDEVWYTNKNVNVAGAWQDGMDLQVSYKYDTHGWGRFNGTLAGTYLRNYVFQALPSSPADGYQDGFFARGSGTSRNGVFARYRLNTRIDWSHKDWTAGVAHTYVPSIDDITSPTRFRVAKYHSFDLQVGHSFANWGNKWLKGLTASVGVNNVFNKFPPYIPSEGNQSHDINAYDPIGRFVYVQAKYKF